MRGQCYDDASSMNGEKTGVATQIKALNRCRLQVALTERRNISEPLHYKIFWEHTPRPPVPMSKGIKVLVVQSCLTGAHSVSVSNDGNSTSNFFKVVPFALFAFQIVRSVLFFAFYSHYLFCM